VKLKILFEQRLDELVRLIAQNVGKTVAEAHGAPPSNWASRW